MITDVTVRLFATDPSTVGVSVSMKGRKAIVLIPRGLITWEPANAVEELMLGDLTGVAGEALVNNVTVQVSKWLLLPDLNPLLTDAFQDLDEAERIRFLFTTDDKLDATFDFSRVPVELLRPAEEEAYALDNRVAGLVHVRERARPVETQASSLIWPLRVLIFRANPSDSDPVPIVAPLHQYLSDLGQDVGAAAIKVDVVSSEPEYGLRADLSALRTRLEAVDDPYDVFVFLGHGNFRDDLDRPRPSLRLEASDGIGGQDISAADLAALFADHPVPVVLIVACRSAPNAPVDGEARTTMQREVTRWMRGSQGVAQALVSSEACRVQVVVGMRYRLDANDAATFLRAFFRSLIKLQPGHVEAAIAASRRALKNESQFPAAYSAPVVLRPTPVGEAEPVLPFLGTKVPGCSEPKGSWRARDIAWNQLMRSRGGAENETVKLSLGFAVDVQDLLIGDAISEAGHCLVMPQTMPQEKPASILVGAGQDVVVPIRLYGELAVGKLKSLTGRIRVTPHPAEVTAVGEPAELAAAGYVVTTRTEGDDLIFEVTPRPGVEVTPLKDLEILDIKVRLGGDVGLRYEISVYDLDSQPAASVCPGMNALIVPIG